MSGYGPMPLRGEGPLVDALEGVLERLRPLADAVELVYAGGERHLTRFAGNNLTQGMLEQSERVTVRLCRGQQVGLATAGSLEPEALDEAARRALAAALVIPPDPHFPGFPAPRPLRRMAALAFDEETAALTIDAKADALGGAFRRAARSGVTLAGRYHTLAEELAVVSTRGVRAYHANTRADVALFADADGAAGYAGGLSRAVGSIDVGALTERAVEKALHSRGPLAVPPGAYDVVLEPSALGEVLEWMALVCFTARSQEDGSSFAADGLGRRITGDAIELYDEGESEEPEALPLPFDLEGQPKKRLELLRHGAVMGVAHDSRSAARAGVLPTGHAAEDTLSGERLAVPTHLFVAPGQLTVPELVGRVERGLYVTRFHYVCGTLDPRRASMTGMTRDGTFLIENGRVTRPVENLRWSESILGAFERVGGLSLERHAQPGFLGQAVTVAPYALIRGWTFTGRQEHG